MDYEHPDDEQFAWWEWIFLIVVGTILVAWFGVIIIALLAA